MCSRNGTARNAADDQGENTVKPILKWTLPVLFALPVLAACLWVLSRWGDTALSLIRAALKLAVTAG